MDTWLKRGALALVLGALCSLSGAASAEPKPGILTPPTKAPAAAGAKGDDKGKGDEKGAKGNEKGNAPESAGSAGPAGSAAPAGSAGTVAGGPEDEKAKEAAMAKRKEWKEMRKAKAKDVRADVKKKVEAALKGQPMVNAMKEELKRHARRLARLERAKSVADEAKDADTIARVDKLIAKENERHDKWMAKFDAKAAGGDKAGAK